MFFIMEMCSHSVYSERVLPSTPCPNFYKYLSGASYDDITLNVMDTTLPWLDPMLSYCDYLTIHGQLPQGGSGLVGGNGHTFLKYFMK